MTNASHNTDSPAQGMALAIVGMFLLPGMDVIAKHIGQSGLATPGVIAFGRFSVQVVLSMLWIVVIGGGFAALKPQRFWINFLRGVLIALASLLFFVAVKYMPVADAIAVFFVEPLILTLLSVVALKEKVGIRRLMAVVTGFLGALIVVQPSFAIFGWVSLLPLATATLFALYLLLNRVAGRSDDAWVMQFVSGLGGVTVLIAALLFGELSDIHDLSMMVPTHWSVYALLLLMGLIGLTGHFMVVRAFQMAPASLLAPFQYVEIVSAVLLGFILFGDFPTFSKWIGITIIVASGLYVYRRENQRA